MFMQFIRAVFPKQASRMSSAYAYILSRGISFVRLRSRSFRYRFNSTGDSREPWKTPFVGIKFSPFMSIEKLV
jgi:hypothetical protein